MKATAVIFRWCQVEMVDADGVATKAMAMVPLPRYGNVAKRQFHDGEDYPLQAVEERSMASHNQFMAAITDGYHNIPENIFYLRKNNSFELDDFGQRILRWPTPTHLRKWLLCECGYCDVDEFEFDNQRDVMRLARFVRTDNEFAQIKVNGQKVTIKRPHSQKLAAMNKESFENSKRDCLDLLESMIGVKRGELLKNAGHAI